MLSGPPSTFSTSVAFGSNESADGRAIKGGNAVIVTGEEWIVRHPEAAEEPLTLSHVLILAVSDVVPHSSARSMKTGARKADRADPGAAASEE